MKPGCSSGRAAPAQGYNRVMTARLRVFIIAGEPSGDALGGHLLAGLARSVPNLDVRGIGGPAMAGQGLRSLFPMAELSIMGLTEVLPKLPGLLARVSEAAQAAIEFRPDVLITIDSPDFCLRVAKKVKQKAKIPVVHYVAPSVWAWRPGRAAKMARVVDHVLALLPFEPPYMEAAGMSCDFVGHPVAGLPQIGADEARAFRASIGVDADTPMLCVLPGSRGGEVKRHAPIFAETVRRLRQSRENLSIIVPAPGHLADQVGDYFEGLGAVILDPSSVDADDAERRKLAAFAASDGALAASGTVSLELARQMTPMVIGYRMAPLTQVLVRRLFSARSATLVNLVSDSSAVPEFFFEHCTPENLVPAIALVLDSDHGQAAAMRETIDRLQAGEDAAAASVLRFLSAEF